jgi:hypothetical protein
MSVLFFLSCDDNSVEQPVFSVSLADGQVIEQIGDTLVCSKNSVLKFGFSGNPDMLVFYSGEPGNEYRYRDRTEIDGIPSVQFTTTLTYGTQFNGLKVYISSAFPGITRIDADDRANIANMEYWEDITGQCNLPTSKNSPDNVTTTPSIDLSGFKDKPLYIAFRLFHPQGGESTWRLSGLRIVNTFNGVENLSGSFETLGFTAFDMVASADPYLSDGGTTDKSNKRWDFTKNANGYITVGGSTGNTVDNDDWAISDRVNLTRTNPDLGTAIKAFDSAPLVEYEYEYSATGVYIASFVGVNARMENRRETVRELIIKIVE